MGHTNSTPNIGLPQFIGTDKPTWLGDVNGAMSAIDTKVGSIDAAVATVDAKADNAVADASGAVTTATNAVNTAGAASTTATQANNLATQALTVANNTADLCTDQIVPDVQANKTAIGTLADLTTTDKSNLVNAINEVAQGGGGTSWQSVATVTGTADITEPANYTEAMVVVNTNNDNLAVFTQNFPKAALVSGMQFRGGNDKGGYIFTYTTGKFNLQDIVVSGTNYTAATTTTLYYR